MNLGRRALPFVGLTLLFILSGCTISLAEDITPPPGAQAPLAASPSPVPDNLPFVPPDPAAGASIYQEKCAPCHGNSGKGDGVQAGNLTSAPAAIGTAAIARSARPVDWFTIVNNGHLAKFMPSTSGILNDRQRWDVLAYVFNLSVTLNELSTGMDVYQQECVICHGDGGRGDGAHAASLGVPIPDWSDPAVLAQKSLQDLHDSTNLGTSQNMPGYAGTLNDDQIRAVASYIRSFWYTAPTRPQTLSGATQPGEPATATPPVPPVEQASPTLDLGKTELTADISGLVADRLHVILDFPTQGVLQVAEVVIITNTQNKMVAPAAAGQAVLNFDLPQGAVNLNFQDGVLGGRFIQTEKGFGDTQPIPPGSGYQLVFDYNLPYDGQSAITLSVPVQVSQVVVMLPDDGVTLTSRQLQFAGTRDVQGSSLQLFVGSNLVSGSPLQVNLSGSPKTAAPAGSGSDLDLLVGLGTFVLALAGVGFWFYRRQTRPAAPALEGIKTRRGKAKTASAPVEETEESLLDAIVALDDLFREGKLDKEPYQSRRNELVRALKEKRKLSL